jgi:hypothetical protein
VHINIIYKQTVWIVIIFLCSSVFGIVIFLEKLCSGKTKSSTYSAFVHRWIYSNFGREVRPTLLFTLNDGDQIWNHFAQVGIPGSFFLPIFRSTLFLVNIDYFNCWIRLVFWYIRRNLIISNLTIEIYAV